MNVKNLALNAQQQSLIDAIGAVTSSLGQYSPLEAYEALKAARDSVIPTGIQPIESEECFFAIDLLNKIDNLQSIIFDSCKRHFGLMKQSLVNKAINFEDLAAEGDLNNLDYEELVAHGSLVDVIRNESDELHLATVVNLWESFSHVEVCDKGFITTLWHTFPMGTAYTFICEWFVESFGYEVTELASHSNSKR